MNNQINLANTMWTSFYENLQGCNKSNKHLTELLGYSNPLLTGQGCFMPLANEGDLTLLSVAPNLADLQLLHQPKNLGGNRANLDFHCVALLSFNNVAAPISINAGTNNCSIHVLPPTWVLLYSVLGNIKGSFSMLAPTEVLNIKNTMGLTFSHPPSLP